MRQANPDRILLPARLLTSGNDPAVQRALLAAIVESSDDAIVSMTPEGRIVSWNAGAVRIFGYAPEEAIGQSVTLIVPPELHSDEQRILEEIRSGRRIDHYDTVRVTRDGRRIDISLTVSPVRDARGVIIGASKVARDVSERKRAERALRESEALLSAETQALTRLSKLSARLWRSRQLAEGLDEMLAAVCELLGANKGNVQLLDGRSKVLSIVAQRGFEPHFLTFFARVTDSDDSACALALRLGERVIVEDTETDPSFAPLRSSARAADFRAVISSPLIGSDGACLGIVSTHFRAPYRPGARELERLDLYLRQASDFIQRCRLEQSLRESEQALREADRRKNEFLALLAHELRNPLAPIRYAVAAANKHGRTAEQQRRAEEVIDRQVAHMSRLLDDLLDISRITRGTLELKRSRTELTSVIGAAIETARPLIDAKGHKLSLELPRHAVQLEADAVRLAQVFANLLINAAKYTDPGGEILLCAAQEGAEVTVAVRDNGIGIPAESVPHLFTLFSQPHRSRGHPQDGLGVGLALVRGLLALHGGGVTVHSDGEGRGSEFIVRLPLGKPMRQAIAEPAPAPAGDDSRAATLRILVVDDSRDAADTCATLLELSGHHVEKAYGGFRALEIAAEFRPQVVLLDIGLPDIDGYTLARSIRSEPWGAEMLLIAVTGWGHEEDRRRALDAGFDRHLTKPVAVEALDALLGSLRLPAPALSERGAQQSV
jgi:PAS domain S-box-containing protein